MLIEHTPVVKPDTLDVRPLRCDVCGEDWPCEAWLKEQWHLAFRDLAIPPLPPGAPPEAHAERERLIAIYELPTSTEPACQH